MRHAKTRFDRSSESTIRRLPQFERLRKDPVPGRKVGKSSGDKSSTCSAQVGKVPPSHQSDPEGFLAPAFIPTKGARGGPSATTGKYFVVTIARDPLRQRAIEYFQEDWTCHT